MSTDSVASYLIHKLDQQRNIVKDRILRGDLLIDEYKRLAGINEGITYAIDLINDTQRRIAHDEVLEDE
jgi:hypothetical protein